MGIQKPSHTLAKIHLKALRTKSLHILFTLSFTMFINMFCLAQELPKPKEPIKPITKNDTVVKDTTVVSIGKLLDAPKNSKETDSTKIDYIPKKKEFLTGIVDYTAKDYVRLDQRKNTTTLYNKAEVNYGDMNIKSGIIVINHGKDLVYAGRLKDSLGNYSQPPIFTQGQSVVEPDSVIFNTVTKKAIIFNSKTEQSGGTIIAEISKRENDSTIFIKNGKFTTSENLDDPEYYFLMRTLKLVPGVKVVTGFTNLFIYDVPTPIGLPFAYFPMTKKQSSGVIMPTPGQELANDRGYFLQNGGYYFAISEYLDLAVLGDYYTNGSYGLRLETNYAKRYRYQGNLSFRYENLINSEPGFPDFQKSTIYNFRWSHSQDAKSNPSSRFSASVNLGSSQFFRQSINQLNLASALNNTLASSVSYSKTFKGEPQVNMNVTATHSQNTNTEVINLTLPTIQASVGRMFPFAPKTGSKKGIIQNINFQYNVRGENRIQTTDSLFFKAEMFDGAQVGALHSIPISTNFKVFNYFSMSASMNLEEAWTLNTVNKFYDDEEEVVITEDLNEFDRFFTYNFSTSIGTTVYGMFDFRKEGKDPQIQQIRHVMRPSISYNINPAFDQYYDSFEIANADGDTVDEEQRQQYTRFEGSLFGTPNQNFSSSMGISLGNNFEAKVRDRDSTATEPKKIKLLDNLNFQTSYNFAGDSLKFSPLRVSGGTTILKDKMNINFGMILDPYALDNNNRKIEQFNIQNGGSLFRLTSASLNISYSISSKAFEGNGEEDDAALQDNLRSGGRADDLFGKPQDFADQRLSDEDDKKDKEPSELYNYKIPWSLRLAYVVNYGNAARQNEISSHSLMFSGDIELSPKWSLGASSGYDVVNQGFTQTQLRFERDLLSWRMNFSWVPFGPQNQWNFFIGITSSLLQDLKYDKRKQRDQQL